MNGAGTRDPTTQDELGASLAGVRVVDLTRNFAGPFCTMALGDLGADVVKVERPGSGDDTRSWRPPEWRGESTAYLSANRGKRGIAVDLDTDEGAEVVMRLARRADVFVESFRPGSLEKRGLGYEQLAVENPRLIHCSISAFGEVGPERATPGYDPVIQALTGIMSVTGEADGQPVRSGVALVDLGAALWATIGVLASLNARGERGSGMQVRTSLFEVGAWWMSYAIAGFLGSGLAPTRLGTAAGFVAPYEVYPTGRGDLLIAAANDRLFATLAAVLERPELAQDARFVTNADRVKNRVELSRMISDELRRQTADQWERVLKLNSVPCSQVRTVPELLEDPQFMAAELLQRFSHPVIDDLQLIGVPITGNGRRPVQALGPPLLGQHTDEVLEELGYSTTDIVRLRAEGTVA